MEQDSILPEMTECDEMGGIESVANTWSVRGSTDRQYKPALDENF
jgi:hypothetical protein